MQFVRNTNLNQLSNFFALWFYALSRRSVIEQYVFGLLKCDAEKYFRSTQKNQEYKDMMKTNVLFRENLKLIAQQTLYREISITAILLL